MNILFVCRGNFFRSQLAEYFFNKSSKKHKSFSAGIDKKDYYGIPMIELLKKDPVATVALKKLNIDFEGHVPKYITTKMIEKADKIIAILESDKIIPKYLKEINKLEFWRVPDGVFKSGKIKSINTHLKIMRIIRNQVNLLVKRIEN